MHICFVSGSYPPIKSGIGDYTYRLADAIAEMGHSVDVLTSAIKPIDDRMLIKVHPVVSQWDRRAVGNILDKLRSTQADIVHVQYPTEEYGRRMMINILPWLIESHLKVPVVVTIHEYSTFTALGRARLALTARLSRAVIATNQTDAALIRRWAGGPAGKYAVIPIGPNLDCSPPPSFDWAVQRAQLGAGADTVVLAYFGFIGRLKGLDVLLSAFEIALAGHPDLDLRLLILADKEPVSRHHVVYHMAFADQLSRSPVRDRIVWTGYMDPAAVSAHLLASDVAVLPFDDGASLRRTTLIAALTHSLPVISTWGVSVAQDGLDDSCGLLLTPARDVPALAQAIVMLSQDRAMREQLSVRADQYAGAFSWQNVATQTIQVYQKAR